MQLLCYFFKRSLHALHFLHPPSCRLECRAEASTVDKCGREAGLCKMVAPIGSHSRVWGAVPQKGGCYSRRGQALGRQEHIYHMRLPALSQPLSLVPQPPQHFLSSSHSRNKGKKGRAEEAACAKVQKGKRSCCIWCTKSSLEWLGVGAGRCEAGDHVLKGVGQWGVPSWL